MENFGLHLKDWRNRRRMSQMDLGLQANVSSRHIAFLETGRSKPSREMVLQLSEALMVPRAERNALLNAAGFAPAYQKHTLDDDELFYVRQAAEWQLERHHPYPAFAYDRHWHLVMANGMAHIFLQPLGVGVGSDMLEMFLTSPVIRQSVENWAEVARHIAVRLRTESSSVGGDARLEEAAARLAKESEELGFSHDTPLQVVMPTRYRLGEVVVSLFSTIAQYGSVEDIALADLRIELLFPADEVSKQVFEEMG